jgi:hypothetical protein
MLGQKNIETDPTKQIKQEIDLLWRRRLKIDEYYKKG